MTVSTVSNDYAKKQLQNQIRNYKKLDKEKTATRKGTKETKRRHTRQTIRKGYYDSKTVYIIDFIKQNHNKRRANIYIYIYTHIYYYN